MGRYMFIDFDGVINALWPPAHERVWSDSMSTEVLKFGITYSPTLVEDLEMIAEGGVEIIWLTTWLSDTVTFPLLGFSKYPYLGEGFWREQAIGGWWKWDALQAFIQDLPEGDHQFAWLDDDIQPAIKDLPEIGAFIETDGVLAITPDTNIGLMPHHLVQIQEFFRREAVAA